MATYNFQPHRKGDTFNGVEFEVLVNGTPKDLTGATIAAKFRLAKSLDAEVKQTMSIGSGITITDAPAAKFKIDQQVIDWPAGTYFYDIQITYADGVIKTYIEGSFTIQQDITY